MHYGALSGKGLMLMKLGRCDRKDAHSHFSVIKIYYLFSSLLLFSLLSSPLLPSLLLFSFLLFSSLSSSPLLLSLFSLLFSFLHIVDLETSFYEPFKSLFLLLSSWRPLLFISYCAPVHYLPLILFDFTLSFISSLSFTHPLSLLLPIYVV